MSLTLFLGAGASADAGYPLTAHLLTEMEVRFANSLFSQEKEDWQRFAKFRDSANGALSMVLMSRNPELVLTVPDLLEAALSDSDAENWRMVKAAATAGDEASANQANAHWNDPRRDQLVQAVLAKQAFQRLADKFFSHKHCSDSENGARDRRSYLQNALANIAEDDTPPLSE